MKNQQSTNKTHENKILVRPNPRDTGRMGGLASVRVRRERTERLNALRTQLESLTTDAAGLALVDIAMALYRTILAHQNKRKGKANKGQLNAPLKATMNDTALKGLAAVGNALTGLLERLGALTQRAEPSVAPRPLTNEERIALYVEQTRDKSAAPQQPPEAAGFRGPDGTNI